MQKSYLKSLTMAVFSVFLFTTNTFAAGAGAFHLFASDAEALGKGGAFVGEADNPSAIVYNPAGTTQLKGGEVHASVGMALIQPMVDHTSLTGVETQARRDLFFIPHVYAVTDFGHEKLVFGLGVTSNWGLGTDWAEDSFSRYVATKTEIENMDNIFTIGYQVNEKFSVAAGWIYGISKLNKEKSILQTATTDAEGQLKGDDDSIGYTLSGLYRHSEEHQFGFMYRSTMQFQYEGNVTAEGFIDTAGTTYATTFGGASYKTPFSVDATLPQSLALGYSYTPNDTWRFNFDFQWMDWSSIQQERVTFPEEANALRVGTLQALVNSDRDWESTFNFSLGTEYTMNEDFRLRGGYFYIPTPIPEAHFDSAIPVSDGHGINAGFGYNLSEDMILDFTWTGILYEDWNVINDIGAALGGDVDGKYENFVNISTATLTYKF